MIKRGVSRTVLLVAGVAIKVPSFRNGIKYFVFGMLGNILERERWQLSKQHPNLAPVFFCLPFGLLSVQRRYRTMIARRLTREETAAFPFLNFDNNGENVAVDGDRLVLVDYGNTDWYLATVAR